jgi:hypothetical protein
MARVVHGTLVANAVTAVAPGKKARQARILNIDGTARIYVRGDGVDPEDPWDDCDLIPAAIGYITVKLRADPDGNPEVRMVSPGTPEFSVTFIG